MIKRLKQLFLLFTLFACIGIAPAFAEETPTQTGGDLSKPFFLPNPLAGQVTPDSGTKETGEADSLQFFSSVLGQLLVVMLNLLAGLAIVPIVVGGVMMITSAGDSGRVEKGKASIKWGLIGLVAALAAIGVFQFLLQFLLPS